MTDRAAYRRHRERVREHDAAESLEGRDIGRPPRPKRPAVRGACCRNFRRFCLTYFPWSFALPFSPDHLKVIAKIETSVLQGGLFAVAMPRGSGKTTLAECACLWALLYGHRRFVVLIAAEKSLAESMLESIKLELETNAHLARDFPEVCYPIERLERIANRCKGQLSEGRPTYISWTARAVVLPTIRGSAASGGIIKAAGLEASLRGTKFKRPDGRSVRPDLVVIDDPQTDESARSPSQCAYRERVIAGAVLGMAGPGEKIAGVMPCTVVAPGDLAENLLDPQKHPEWRGERTKLVYAEPEDKERWDHYAELRRESLRNERGGAEATEFYRENRAAMDAGAAVAWPERFEPDCLSALQWAMNLRIDRPEVFAAEYQNDPLPLVPAAPDELRADAVAARVNRVPRGTCPAGSTRVTAFVDVQADLLFWAVCAWQEGFGGAVVDYGAYPDQGRGYFSLADARPTLAAATGVPSLEGSIYAGLSSLAALLLGREWPLAGGGALKVERCLVDEGWGLSTEVVRRFCRQSPHAAVLLPSKGIGIGPQHNPVSEWPIKPGERRGPNWVIRPPGPGQPRRALFDTNSWKTLVAAKLRQPMGEGTALVLFGDDAGAHRLLADHLTAEFAVKTFGRGREVLAWDRRPNRENHLWDCIIGCAVAASMLGIEAPGVPKARGGRRQRVSMAEMRARAGR